MTETLFLAVETVIPADHPAAILAVPLGLLFFSGSIVLLLWSNYGLRKGFAIYGTAFFGFNVLLGIFWWLGGPGIPAGLGVSHLPGETASDHAPGWYGFEAGSERAEHFPVHQDLDAFEDVAVYLDRDDLPEEERNRDPLFASTSGRVGAAADVMQQQFLPIDDNGIAQIGSERRQAYEEDVAAADVDARRAPTFFTAVAVGEPRLAEDPESGLEVVTQTFQAQANFVDDEGVPLDPVDVGEPTDWFAFYDPGTTWLPSAIWTVVSLVLFVLSLVWLDAMEVRDRRRAADVVEEPEDLAVPIAQ